MVVRLIDGRDGGETHSVLDDTQTPERAAYLRGFLQHGPAELAATAPLDRAVWLIDRKPVPVIVNDGSERDNYVLSPYAHYVKYMLLELRKIRGATARVLERSVDLLGRISLPLGFNRCVSVNNWLFTTNPKLSLEPAELVELTEALVQRYPDYPIVVRCVDAREPGTRQTYLDAGYRLVVNRPVHEWQWPKLNRHQRSNVRADIKLLGDARFVCEAPARLASGDEQRIHELYTALYVHKHVGYNCHYTPLFFRLVHDSGMMTYLTIRRNGRILAFGTAFDDDLRSVAALVGYDTTLDQRSYPLYRMVVANYLRAGMNRSRMVFLSTGAANFKLCRGSYEWLEYEAVYDRHLPRHRRLPWKAFGAVLDAGTRNLNTSQM